YTGGWGFQGGGGNIPPPKPAAAGAASSPERAIPRPSHEAKPPTSVSASPPVRTMVHHRVRTEASSTAVGAHTVLFQPVNSDHANASTEGRPSESLNSNSPAGPGRGNRPNPQFMPLEA